MTTTDHTRPALHERIAAFPWPFPARHYRYSTNVEPALQRTRTGAGSWGGRIIDIDGDYHDELRQRAAILHADPSRHAVLPHMVPATWDAMLLVMRELAADHPGSMHLQQGDDGSWTWRNDLLGRQHTFVLGDESTLPTSPLLYIGEQVQEDMVLLDQREGHLWGDAGLVTFAADWSMNFDVGMSFLQIHGPVPRVHEEGIIPRAEQFLMRLQPGEPYRRTNWTMSVDHRLDTSTETYPEWGRDRRLLSRDDIGHRLHLRVEVQHLLRLPDSGCVLFLIRSYMMSLQDLATVPEWRAGLASVLQELPQDMVDYKGLTRYRDDAVAWLHAAG
ncbi:heme-dependent oxidative N-demethylase family protein [Kineococcus esterisolvens]|uniref:heme-dependent oxidative N-demethylase family protein n=1 Tax=unclassified Kineococcus TaxID=2621656 RepID=UPI003D7C3C42